MTEELEQTYLDISDKLLRNEKLSTDESILIKDNAEFDLYFEQVRSIRDSLKNLKDIQTKELISKVDSQYRPGTTSTKKKNKILPIVLLALLLLIPIIYFLSPQPKTTDQIFAEHYEAMPLVEITRNKVEVDKEKAFEYYELKDYTKAELAFAELILSDRNTRSLFYYGSTLLENGKLDDAIRIFNSPELIKNIDYPSNFYLGFAHLKKGERDKAIAAFEASKKYNVIIRSKVESILADI